MGLHNASPMVLLEGLGPSLPPAEPHLMPFHIDYNGPAPLLSSYFLVRPCPDEAAPKSLKSRFISAFRGRKLQGLKVNVPEGYVGVVFSPQKGKETETSRKTTGKKGAKWTRPSDHVAAVAEDDLETVKTLAASGVFSSFTLWSPDVNVDEGEDEYIRTLTEYRNLLAEVRCLPSRYSLLFTLQRYIERMFKLIFIQYTIDH